MRLNSWWTYIIIVYRAIHADMERHKIKTYRRKIHRDRDKMTDQFNIEKGIPVKLSIEVKKDTGYVAHCMKRMEYIFTLSQSNVLVDFWHQFVPSYCYTFTVQHCMYGKHFLRESCNNQNDEVTTRTTI